MLCYCYYFFNLSATLLIHVAMYKKCVRYIDNQTIVMT